MTIGGHSYLVVIAAICLVIGLWLYLKPRDDRADEIADGEGL